MGTHPSLPSKDLTTGRTLLDLLEDNQSLQGPEITAKYGNKLPFLFKVLSIHKALSIQAHPNKKLAEQLHAKDPKNYPGKCVSPKSELRSFLQTTITSRK
jgi:mannose-6-phosphate isomerase